MSKVLKNTAIYTIGNIIPQAVAFFLLPLYTKYLSPEQYGIISSMQVLQVFLAVLFTLSLDKSIIRLFWDYKNDYDQRKFLGTISFTILINSLVVLVIVFLLKNIIQSIFNDISFYPYYTYAILTTFFLTFSLIPKNYYRLKNKAIKYVSLSIIEMIFNTTLIIWFIVIQKQGAEGMLKGKLIASILMFPLFLFIIIKHVKFSVDLKMLKSSLQFSLPLIVTLVAAWALGQFDRILIAKYFSMADVGIFSLSKRIAGLTAMLSGSFMLAYHPIFFELANSKNQEVARIKLRKYNNTYIIVITLFAFVIALFSKELIYFLLDSRYFEAHIYIPFIVLSILIAGISSTVIGASFQQSKKMKQDMYIGVTAAIFTVVVGYLLIKPFGISGAVGVSLFSSIFIFTSGLIYANKNCYAVLVDWRRIALNFSIFFVVLVFFTFFKISNIYVSFVCKSIVTLILMVTYFFLFKNEILVLMGKKTNSRN